MHSAGCQGRQTAWAQSETECPHLQGHYQSQSFSSKAELSELVLFKHFDGSTVNITCGQKMQMGLFHIGSAQGFAICFHHLCPTIFLLKNLLLGIQRLNEFKIFL